MSDRDHIRSLIQEAKVYKKHGLLDEAKEKYEELLAFLQNHEQYSKDKKAIDIVKDKIRAVDQTLNEVESAPETPELSQEVQEIISRLFSFSENEDTAAMEKAIALAKFGQYNEAIAAFQGLIKQGILPLVAAKNALRCHVTLASPEAAVAQFNQWVSQKTFSDKELRFLRSSLKEHLAKKGIPVDLPPASEPSPEEIQHEQEEGVIDISSFTVPVKSGPHKGQKLEFQVNFQSGNKISTIISSEQRDLADSFEPGLRLADIECFSPIAVFNGWGTVSGVNRISSGPRKGDYSLDITLEGG